MEMTDGTFHVWNRGVNRADIVFDDADREYFFSLAPKSVEGQVFSPQFLPRPPSPPPLYARWNEGRVRDGNLPFRGVPGSIAGLWSRWEFASPFPEVASAGGTTASHGDG